MSKVATCLWFNGDAEAAATLYTSLLPGSELLRVMRAPVDYPAGKAGDVLMVEFTLAGTPFQGLNGGGGVAHGMAASISVTCEDQAEVDRLWSALTADGGREVQCGWLNDRWGVPWQIVPRRFLELTADPDAGVRERAMAAMMGMVKLDVAALEAAAAG